MKRILFIDRDGTLIREPENEQVDSFEEFRYVPGVFTHLGRIVRQLPYTLVLVTNQDGLGTPSYPEETFWPVQNRMMETFEQEGICFEEVIIDRTFEWENKDTRKPGIGLMRKYLDGDVDIKQSWVIGDRTTDMRLAWNLGCRGIFIGPPERWNQRATPEDELYCTCKANSWEEIADFLIGREHAASVTRTTRETDISIDLSLYGQGRSDLHTGIGFFDHMLDQLARHSNMDLKIRVMGDLNVDEHHTVEDTGLVLGQAVRQALGNLRGMNRYGFVLPMDDSQASVLLDLGGRPYLKWKASFKRERIGELPTELISHFFRSFCDGARCTLHIEAVGDNEHHLVEAMFKALARALKQAWNQDGTQVIPTTK